MSTDFKREALLVEIWAKAVDTQMHFNEMSAKSRQLGLTFVAAALGVAIVLVSQQKDFTLPIGSFVLHSSVLIVLGAAAGLLAVRRLDLGVYHRMLRGAVAFGEDFERQYMKEVFQLDKGMTQAISHFSRHDDASVSVCNDTGKYHYHGTDKKSAEAKIRLFYSLAIAALVFVALSLFLVTNYATVSALLQQPSSP